MAHRAELQIEANSAAMGNKADLHLAILLFKWELPI